MDAYLTKHIFDTVVRQQYHDQLPELIWMDRAFGAMLMKQGILNEENYRQIDQGLTKIEETLKEEDLKAERLDLYFNVTDRLYQEVGSEVGCLLHVGRSRNDMGAACYHMQVRKQIWKVADLLDQVMERIIDQAEKYADSVMTFNTYGQPAQPGTFGHYLMAAFFLFARDHKRLVAAYKTTNQCPLGAAAGMGTAYDIDREYLATALGFDGVIENSLDAVAGVDYLLETETALAIIMSNVSRIAQDFINWSNNENHILRFDLSVSTGSSIMPQKRNPVVLEAMRSRTANTIGLLNTGLALCRNTSLFPTNETSPYLFVNFGQSLDEALKALGLLKLSLEHCIFDKVRAYEHTKANYTFATAMAEYLALRHGIPFADTHYVIRGIVEYLLEQKEETTELLTGALVGDISEKVLGQRIVLSDEEAKQLLEPGFCAGYRVTRGCSSPEETRRLVCENRAVLAKQKRWLETVKADVLNAHQKL